MTTLDGMVNSVCSLTSDGVRLLMREDSKRPATDSEVEKASSSDAMVTEIIENSLEAANNALSQVLFP